MGKEKLKFCPFCGENDFDNIGLKHHLDSGFCEEFEKTEKLENCWERRIAEAMGIETEPTKEE